MEKYAHGNVYIFEFINCQFKTDNMQASWICLSRFVKKNFYEFNVSFLSNNIYTSQLIYILRHFFGIKYSLAEVSDIVDL